MDENEIRDPQAVLDALERAKKDAKEYREKYEQTKAELEEITSQHESLKAVKPDERLRTRVIELEIRKALTEVGADERAMKYINTADLDLNETGEVVNLSSKIDEVRNDLPELFDKKVQVGGAADLFKTGMPIVTESPTQKQVAKLFA